MMAENSASDANATRFEYDTLSRKTEEYLCDDLNVADDVRRLAVLCELRANGLGISFCHHDSKADATIEGTRKLCGIKKYVSE